MPHEHDATHSQVGDSFHPCRQIARRLVKTLPSAPGTYRHGIRRTPGCGPALSRAPYECTDIMPSRVRADKSESRRSQSTPDCHIRIVIEPACVSVNTYDTNRMSRLISRTYEYTFEEETILAGRIDDLFAISE